MRIARSLLITIGFVSGAGAVIMSTVLWHRILNYERPRNHYRIMFSGSVSGLEPGNDVERNGVTAGTVTAISLTKEIPPRVMVDVAVNSGVSVMRDSDVFLDESSAGRFVQITGGTAAAGRDGPGSPIGRPAGHARGIPWHQRHGLSRALLCPARSCAQVGRHRS